MSKVREAITGRDLVIALAAACFLLSLVTVYQAHEIGQMSRDSAQQSKELRKELQQADDRVRKLAETQRQQNKQIQQAADNLQLLKGKQ